MSRLAAPSGAEPPQTAPAQDGTAVDLSPLAEDLCERYFATYPDDVARLGPAGRLWCVHDSRYLLAWAVQDAGRGTIDCVERVGWLGRVLEARGFSLDRLARHVELAADVLQASVFGALGERAAGRLRAGSDALRADGEREADAPPSPGDP